MRESRKLEAGEFPEILAALSRRFPRRLDEGEGIHPMNDDPNITQVTYTYDDRGWLSAIRSCRADGTLVECVTLTRDDAGRILQQTADGEENPTAAPDETGEP